jgi:phosphatidylinositol 4-kinase
MRLLQFLGSHFNATRLGSPHIERAFTRLLVISLEGLKNSTGHPLAREIRFQVILFGLKVLRHSTALKPSFRFRLKDQLLSAALSWFTFAPCWSFGGNRLQLKAEVRLLGDVSAELRHSAFTAQKPTPLMKAIQAKEALLQALIESEESRLTVWLNPLNAPQGSRKAIEVDPCYLLPLLHVLTCARELFPPIFEQLGAKVHL